MNCKNCEYGLKQSCGDFEKILCTYEEGECVKITELKKEIAEMKEQNTNLQEMLKTERSVTCKEEYLKKVTELEQENAELEKKNTALRQDWEIMKNTIADYNDFCDKYMKLEKENAELKERNRELLESCEGATMMYKDLCKAKEIIKELIDFDFLPDVEIKRQAEQFLSEVEK